MSFPKFRNSGWWRAGGGGSQAFGLGVQRHFGASPGKQRDTFQDPWLPQP